MARRIAREEALFAGTSSGANVVASIQVNWLTWRGFGIDRYLRELPAAALAEASPVLWDVLRRDPASAPVSARYPLSEFRTALGLAQQAGRGGKVILTGS